MKLYEIADKYRRLDELIRENDGEIDADAEWLMDALDSAFEDKVDGIGALIAEAEAEEEAYKAEAERLKKKKQYAQNRAENLRNWLRANLEGAGVGKVKGKLFSARPALASIPSISWNGVGDPPERFCRTKVELDGTKAQAFYKANGAMPEGFTVVRSPWLDLR